MVYTWWRQPIREPIPNAGGYTSTFDQRPQRYVNQAHTTETSSRYVQVFPFFGTTFETR
jgi:hypothetical protein